MIHISDGSMLFVEGRNVQAQRIIPANKKTPPPRSIISRVYGKISRAFTLVIPSSGSAQKGWIRAIQAGERGSGWVHRCLEANKYLPEAC